MPTNLAISIKAQKAIISFTVLAFLFALLHLAALLADSYNRQVEIDQEFKFATFNNPPTEKTDEKGDLFTVSSHPRVISASEASCFFNLLLLPISAFLLRKRKVLRLWISTGLISFLFAHFWLWVWATQKSKENIESEAYILKHFSGFNSILMESNIFAITLFALISILFIWQMIVSIRYALNLRQNKTPLP